MSGRLDTEWEDEKVVGKYGSSGNIYVPKPYAGYYAKIMIPDGNGGEDIITKTVGRGKFCGVLYVHKRNIGKKVKVVIPKQEKPQGAD